MKKYAELLKRAKDSYHYYKQLAMRGFVSDTVRRMEARNMSRVELAAALGTSPAYVTKILRGDVNFTLDSMAKLAHAVGGTLRVSIEDVKPAYSANDWQGTLAVVAAPTTARGSLRLAYSKPPIEFRENAARRPLAIPDEQPMRAMA
jgi:transcriptional regulator with XRE-family HTH domain